MRLCLASKRVETTRPLGQLPRYISSSLSVSLRPSLQNKPKEPLHGCRK